MHEPRDTAHLKKEIRTVKDRTRAGITREHPTMLKKKNKKKIEAG